MECMHPLMRVIRGIDPSKLELIHTDETCWRDDARWYVLAVVDGRVLDIDRQDVARVLGWNIKSWQWFV